MLQFDQFYVESSIPEFCNRKTRSPLFFEWGTFITVHWGFDKQDEAGNNVNIGIRDFTI